MADNNWADSLVSSDGLYTKVPIIFSFTSFESLPVKLETQRVKSVVSYWVDEQGFTGACTVGIAPKTLLN